ncbi:hypothetical protein Tco_0848202 [Tanacetum coccineum]
MPSSSECLLLLRDALNNTIVWPDWEAGARSNSEMEIEENCRVSLCMNEMLTPEVLECLSNLVSPIHSSHVKGTMHGLANIRDTDNLRS